MAKTSKKAQARPQSPQRVYARTLNFGFLASRFACTILLVLAMSSFP